MRSRVPGRGAVPYLRRQKPPRGPRWRWVRAALPPLLSASSTVTTASQWGREASGPGGRVGCAARVGGRWAETACLPTALCVIFFSFFFVEMEKERKEGIFGV